MEPTPTIQFLICTNNERIVQIPSLLLPPMPGVSYLVSWQQFGELRNGAPVSGPIQEVLSFLDRRSDVQVFTCHSKGLSKNRNHALVHATGDWLVIADDDCTYTFESLEHIRQAFARHPEAAVLQLQIYDREGHPVHDYPDFSYEYATAPRGTYYSSCELVLHRDASLPRFDERFGIGAYLGCGEEEVFVFQVNRAGLQVVYEPLQLATTDGSTTGTLFATNPAVQRAKGGVLSVLHGPFSALLRCFKFVFFVSRLSIKQRFPCFLQTVKGICYEVFTRHSLL